MNPARASTFEVLPYFWQTTWFLVVGGLATVLAASGAVWFDTRRRMRRRLERAERQRDIERERSRIAQDIHDDLGASLTRISMLSETARSELDRPEHAAVGLNQIYKAAHELTRAMDEIVWAVNPRHDSLEGLATLSGEICAGSAGGRRHPLPPGHTPGTSVLAAYSRCASQFVPGFQGGASQRGQTFRRLGNVHPPYDGQQLLRTGC